jgi:hypothetical protein
MRGEKVIRRKTLKGKGALSGCLAPAAQNCEQARISLGGNYIRFSPGAEVFLIYAACDTHNCRAGCVARRSAGVRMKSCASFADCVCVDVIAGISGVQSERRVN